MNAIQKEPALAAGIVAAVAGVLGVLLVYGKVSAEQAAAWQALAAAILVPLAQAWWTRRQVMPVETIREAGIAPSSIKERAADPAVPKCEAP